MKEASWADCLESNSATKVSRDSSRASSLVETAEERIGLVSDVNERNCNFVLEDYYTSVLEFLQALVALDGYKIINHVCLGYYLRDILKRLDLYLIFDDLRYKRNSLTYYGKRMDFETAKASIEKCKRLIRELKLLVEKAK
ncbi:MAG: hypothetical protein HYT16_03030 [DPANN group archaeon]|nr:hypothetical protein [DPANN group archaeon]